MRALIIVDVQNDFCPGGTLGTTHGAEVAARISDYQRTHHGAGYPIVATKDWHIDPGSHFSEHPDYQDTWPVHCRADTDGARFHPNLDSSLIDATFFKGQHSAAYSGFEGHTLEGESLGGWLREHDVDAVDVVGIATDFCVRATALDALAEGFEVTVHRNLCAAVTEAGGEAALAELARAGAKLAG